jgi:hypothetical protein
LVGKENLTAMVEKKVPGFRPKLLELGENLELTFQEKYEFSIDIEYERIMIANIKKVCRAPQVAEVRQFLLMEHKRKLVQPQVRLNYMLTKHLRYRLFIGCMMQIALQMTGIAIVVFYIFKIFDDVDGSGQMMNTLLAWVRLFTIIPGIWIQTKVRRKKLFVYPTFLQFVFASAIAAMCWTEWYGLLIPAMMLWFVSFMIGFGGVIFLCYSEILPPSGASFT